MLHLPYKTLADGSTSQICSLCSSTYNVSKQPVQSSHKHINSTLIITKAYYKYNWHVLLVVMNSWAQEPTKMELRLKSYAYLKFYGFKLKLTF
jgi:hypothetical protein